MKHIGALLKKFRLEKGLSQEALGLKVGFPQGHLSKIENGLVDLQVSSLVELARTLDLELMLIPRGFVKIVEEITIETTKKNPESRPMYYVGEDNHEE